MSLGQAGRAAVNPITGESRFQPRQQQQQQQEELMKLSQESRRPYQTQETQPDKYLLLFDQMQYFEKQVTQQLKLQSKTILELERELRQKPQQENSTEELDNKIYGLETKLIASDRRSNDLTNKIQMQEQNLKELMYLVKNFQNKDNNEIVQMRGILQEKITEENGNLQKEREKTKALFMEVVRQGEHQERLGETVQTLSQSLEQRIMQIEAKIYNGEKALIQVAQKGDTGMNYINEVNERIEKRVLQLESGLLTLSKDQLKDHDQISRVDSANHRLQEDLKGMLAIIQQDYQSRLENRITEVVNRIVMEHEQRVKQMEEFKSSIQSKNQMNFERQQYENEQYQHKLGALEQFQRADSAKKDEAIKQLQTALETQVNSIFMNLQNEETQRYQHEVAIRSDLLKIQENIKAENELFKQHQSSVIEKITEMIRIEVQNRLSSDVDLKNLTSAIATDIVSDLNQLKDTIDIQHKSVLNQIKNNERDSSDRAEKLSNYIDDEIQKTIKVSSQKYEKVKLIFTKFAEQFKQHLLKYENFSQDSESRIKLLEQNQEMTRTDFQTILEELQDHFLTRIAEEKNNILQSAAQSFQVVEDKINKLEDEQLAKFKILKEAVEENHLLITDKIKLILDQNEAYQQETKNQIQVIVDALKELKDNLHKLEEDHKQQIDDLKTKSNQLQKQIDDQLEQITHIQKDINTLQQGQTSLHDDLEIQQQSLDQTRLKTEDLQKQCAVIEQEQKHIRDYQNLIQQTLDKLNENTNLLHLQIETIKSNFISQQQEITELEKVIHSNQDEIDKVQIRITDEIAAQHKLHENLKIHLKPIEDKVRDHDDNDKKLTLKVQELNQQVIHLDANVKELAKLPA